MSAATTTNKPWEYLGITLILHFVCASGKLFEAANKLSDSHKSKSKQQKNSFALFCFLSNVDKIMIVAICMWLINSVSIICNLCVIN